MRVLVVVGSKHGATFEIGEAVGAAIGAGGAEVDVLRADPAVGVRGYDAFVIGSSVYAGHWNRAVKDFVATHAPSLRERPVWLFSSGPIGNPPKPEEDPVDVAGIVEALSPRGHEVFAGRLDPALLGFGERAVVAALRAPSGDFRDWNAIRAWGSAIVAELARDEVPVSSG
jgi:menaquinone-dependent protoporphyrinogen oxidase